MFNMHPLSNMHILHVHPYVYVCIHICIDNCINTEKVQENNQNNMKNPFALTLILHYLA